MFTLFAEDRGKNASCEAELVQSSTPARTSDGKTPAVSQNNSTCIVSSHQYAEHRTFWQKGHPDLHFSSQLANLTQGKECLATRTPQLAASSLTLFNKKHLLYESLAVTNGFIKSSV